MPAECYKAIVVGQQVGGWVGRRERLAFIQKAEWGISVHFGLSASRDCSLLLKPGGKSHSTASA